MGYQTHLEHMAKPSVHYPETLFELHGNGEDDYDFWSDYWRGYWKNGKAQTCRTEIVCSDFDEAKMLVECDPLPIADPPKKTTEQFQVDTKGGLLWDF